MEPTARDVKGIWIPIEIWESPELTPFEKVLLAEIDSLDNGEGCFKSDANLAKRMMCSAGHLRNTLSSLRRRKWVKTLKRGIVRWLRTRFSRHRKCNLEITSKCNLEITSNVRETLHSSSTKMKTKNTVKNGAGAPSPLFGLFDLEDNTPPRRLARRFLNFLIRENLHQCRSDLPDGNSPQSKQR